MPVHDAAVLEILRAIKSLIDKGRVAAPARTIRVLLNQERYGSSAFYATHPDVRVRTLAGVYLDEPCYDPKRESSPIVVHLNPDPQAHFSDVLMLDIASHCFGTYAPMLTWKTAGCGGGDTAVTDPTIGIPMNWVTCPVRRYHHNSIISDFSCLDPEFFHVNITLNATFACFIATAGPCEAAWLGARIASRARKIMLDEIDCALSGCLSEEDADVGKAIDVVRRRLEYQQMLYTRRMAGLERLLGPADARARKCITQLTREVAGLAAEGVRLAGRRVKPLTPAGKRPVAASERKLTKPEREAQGIVPRRLTMGLPVQYVGVPLAKREQVYKMERLTPLMWADGKRDLLDIIRLVEDERGEPVTDIKEHIAYFRALMKYGYLERMFP